MTVGTLLFYVLISGVSMEPTLKHGEKYEVVALDTVARGDIVLFQFGHRVKKGLPILVKRVAACPGDTLAFDVYRLEKGYPVPANKYILLSDNPAAPYDSRMYGPVDRAALIGQIKLQGAL